MPQPVRRTCRQCRYSSVLPRPPSPAQQGNINVSIGRVSFETAKLEENFKALKDALMKAKPATVKGAYIKNVVVSSTMGPGVKVDFSNF